MRRLALNRQRVATNLVLLLVLVPIAAAILIPYMWMITTSLKPRGLIGESPYLFPAHFEFGNYLKAWDAAPFPRYYLNTLIVAVGVVVSRVVIAGMAAYVFAFLKFRGRDVLFFSSWRR
jgi:multiple sugar transport system permease protein